MMHCPHCRHRQNARHRTIVNKIELSLDMLGEVINILKQQIEEQQQNETTEEQQQRNETTEEQQNNQITEESSDDVIVVDDEVINFEYHNDNIEYGEDVIFIYEKRRIM